MESMALPHGLATVPVAHGHLKGSISTCCKLSHHEGIFRKHAPKRYALRLFTRKGEGNRAYASILGTSSQLEAANRPGGSNASSSLNDIGRDASNVLDGSTVETGMGGMGERRVGPSLSKQRRDFHKYCREGAGFRAITAYKDLPIKREVERATLLTVLEKAGEMDAAVQLFEELARESGDPPTMFAQISLLNAYCRAGRMPEACVLMNKMDGAGGRELLLDQHTLAAIINGFAAAGNHTDALSWYEHARSRGIGTNVVVTNTLLKALCKGGQMQRAMAVLTRLKESGLADLRSFNTVMSGWARLGEPKECAAVLEELKAVGRKPDVGSYGCLVSAYCVAKDLDGALKVVEGMKAAGVRCNAAIYSTIMNGRVEMGDIAGGFAMLDRMTEDRIAPDVYTYTTLVKACCESGDLDRALALVTTMKEGGVRPNARTYATLMNGWARRGNYHMAQQTMEEMTKACRMTKPPLVAFNLLLKAAVRGSDLKQALQVRASMRAQGVKPDNYSYSTLIEGAAGAGSLSLAFDLFNEMKESGVRAGVIEYGAIIKACCKCLEMDTALRLAREMVAAGIPHNSRTYTILVDGYTRMGDLPSAYMLVEKMKADGLHPTASTYTCLVNGHCKMGDMARASALVEKMKSLGVEPRATTYRTLLRGWLQAGNLDEAVRSLAVMRENGFPPNGATYSLLVYWLLDRLGSASADTGESPARHQASLLAAVHRLLGEMRDAGITLGKAAMTRLMDKATSSITGAVKDTTVIAELKALASTAPESETEDQ
eukprot:jgi/Mesvir1/291/Mv13621-RA.1